MNPSIRGKLFLKLLTRSKHGTLDLELPHGEKMTYGEGSPRIQVKVHDWKALDLLVSKGDLGLAEAVIQGTLEADDFAGLVQWACQNEKDLSDALHGKWYGNLTAYLKHILNRNNEKQAKKNIMSHYDLGNEFYRLWLDPTMTYSSALFLDSQKNLQEAQLAKYDRIIDLLKIKSSDHVLEIGCGWGGFFSRAVEKTGCKVTAVMNSPQQARHNRELINKKHLLKNVELIETDYRNIQGNYDKIVSIEMIEAVGESYWNTFFGKMRSSLKSGGQSVIQGITIRDDLFSSYRKGTDFIQQYIFPGGMLLANQIFQQKSKEHEMHLEDTFEFGIHYADTLKIWRENFNRVVPQLMEMGFDDKFIRLWSFYLSYCEGAFRAGRINVGQFLIQA